MNRVFENQLRKGRGLLAFSATERKVLIGVAVAAFALFNVILAVGAGSLALVGLLLHRRLDNHRADHLELLARRWGLWRPPWWSLCERDSGYVRYEPK